MRQTILLIAALGLAACGAPAPTDGGEAGPADVAALSRFADQFDRAQLEKDRAALERMVADDLVFITGEGERLGKAEFIAGWTAPGDSYDPIALVDRIVRPIGADGVVVTAETTLSGTSGEQRFSSRFRFSDTFERTGGEWRAVHIQVTRIAD